MSATFPAFVVGLQHAALAHPGIERRDDVQHRDPAVVDREGVG